MYLLSILHVKFGSAACGSARALGARRIFIDYRGPGPFRQVMASAVMLLCGVVVPCFVDHADWHTHSHAHVCVCLHACALAHARSSEKTASISIKQPQRHENPACHRGRRSTHRTNCGPCDIIYFKPHGTGLRPLSDGKYAAYQTELIRASRTHIWRFHSQLRAQKCARKLRAHKMHALHSAAGYHESSIGPIIFLWPQQNRLHHDRDKLVCEYALWFCWLALLQ